MEDSVLQSFLTLLAALLALVGGWRLHRRLRNRASATFFYSTLALLIWALFSPLVIELAVGMFADDSKSLALNLFAYASQFVIPNLLMLTAFISWLLVVRWVGTPMHLSIGAVLLFGLVFLGLLWQASWYTGASLSWSKELYVPAAYAVGVASAASLAFWVSAYRSSSRHSMFAVLTFAIGLLLVLNLSNKLLLPGWLGPALATTVAAHVFGSMGSTGSRRAGTG